MHSFARRITTTVAVLVLAAGATAVNAQTPKTPAAKSAVGSRHAGRRHATSLVARGTIASFDHTTNMLTITTSKGPEQFALPATARIQEASKHLTMNDLGAMNGRTVNIRYRESGGQRTVQSVRVAGTAKKAKS